jgi:hypothetical protein
MTNQQQRYRSYLLRMWEIADEEGVAWRASLETPGTGQRRGFGSLPELFAYLSAQAELRESDPTREQPAATGEEGH